MEQTKLEKSYELMLSAIDILKVALNAPFLEGYLENGSNILDKDVQVVDGVPNAEQIARLKKIYTDLDDIKLTPADQRKLSQLLLLKGSLEDNLTPNHQLTPDTIGYLFLFFIEQLLPQKDITLLDPALGTGNLLATVIAGLAGQKTVKGFGVENDDLMIEIAALNSEGLHQDTQFFHQDALQPLLLDPVDAVIADLPVGYYPNDERAHEYKTGELVTDGHTFSHHLIIEASFNYLLAGGFGIYLVPADLFSSAQAKEFTHWMKGTAYLQAFIELPDNLFNSENSRKAVLILQKPGNGAKQVSEVLLAKLSSLTEPKKVQHFFQQFAAFKQANFS